MGNTEVLQLTLGILLMIAGALSFSIWRDRFKKLKEEERSHFLMYNVVGGAWLFSVFFICGGIYAFFEPLIAF